MLNSQFKTLDSKGRLPLGSKFAGQVVQVTERDGEIVVVPCRVVHDREGWLWENEQAISSVRKGLKQAYRGELIEGPDLEKAFKFAWGLPATAHEKKKSPSLR